MFFAGFLLGGWGACAEGSSLFVYDTFDRADSYDIDAESQGMSGLLSPVVYVESFEGAGPDSIQVHNHHLQMATGNGMGTMYLDHNFVDSAILANGGFTVMLDILEISGGDNPQDRFGGFGVGLTAAELAAASDSGSGTALRCMADGTGAVAVSDFYIDLAMDGILRAWAGNTLLSAMNVAAASGQVRVDFLMPDFAMGQTAIGRIYFNGRWQDTVSFTWDHTNQNYIGFSARATDYVIMDNLVIMPYASVVTNTIDLTGEGDVNLADVAIVADQWSAGYVAPCPEADLNADCLVDLKDLKVLGQHWLNWRHYHNPVIDLGKRLADPAVLFHNGVYYLYATGDASMGYRVYTSTNLVNWTRGPQVFYSGRPNDWAPDVWRDPVSGKFYLYYTVQSAISDQQTVGVAQATSPFGPFSNAVDLFENAIDAHLFRDDDGSLYLYYVQQPGFHITAQPMADPRTPSGQSNVVIQPESAWEKLPPFPVTEGPWMIKRNGIYYLLYSGSHAGYPNYATGYATADNPMGPFTRAIHNPIVQRSQTVFGPGHGCAVQDAAGDWWHVYHQKRYDTDDDFNRYICLDRLWFDQVGNLYGRATRTTLQIAPAAE